MKRPKKERTATPEHLALELREFCQALPETSYVSLEGGNGFSFHFPADAVTSPAQSRMMQHQFAIERGDSFISNSARPPRTWSTSWDCFDYCCGAWFPWWWRSPASVASG